MAKAYLNKWGDEPVLQDIAHMRLHRERVELETLLGEKKIIPGRVVEVDFATSRILLDEHGEPGGYSERRRGVINQLPDSRIKYKRKAEQDRMVSFRRPGSGI